MVWRAASDENTRRPLHFLLWWSCVLCRIEEYPAFRGNQYVQQDKSVSSGSSIAAFSAADVRRSSNPYGCPQLQRIQVSLKKGDCLCCNDLFLAISSSMKLKWTKEDKVRTHQKCLMTTEVVRNDRDCWEVCRQMTECRSTTQATYTHQRFSSGVHCLGANARVGQDGRGGAYNKALKSLGLKAECGADENFESDEKKMQKTLQQIDEEVRQSDDVCPALDVVAVSVVKGDCLCCRDESPAVVPKRSWSKDKVEVMSTCLKTERFGLTKQVCNSLELLGSEFTYQWTLWSGGVV